MLMQRGPSGGAKSILSPGPNIGFQRNSFIATAAWIWELMVTVAVFICCSGPGAKEMLSMFPKTPKTAHTSAGSNGQRFIFRTMGREKNLY